MLLLAFLPCGDGGNNVVEMAYNLFDIEHEHQSDHEHHSNNCDDDFCSPFCSCSCCSLSLNTEEKPPIAVYPPSVFTANTPSFLDNILPSPFLNAIWQPPRLG